MSSDYFAPGRGRAARPSEAASDQAILAAAAHLTARDRHLVRAVAEHRVLTTGQLAALGFGSVITARHRLAMLVQIGALRRFRPHREVGSAPWQPGCHSRPDQASRHVDRPLPGAAERHVSTVGSAC
jgi:hypothetical protein